MRLFTNDTFTRWRKCYIIREWITFMLGIEKTAGAWIGAGIVFLW
jgi:hypothetical protein